MITRRRALILVLAAALFWLCHRAYWVGLFNDDAYYLIGARSLLTGRFAELQTPGAPPLVNYLPGWPLLLAPVVALARHSLAALQAFSIALHVAALGLLGLVFEREDSEETADLALIAVAVSPLISSTAATLLADGPMLFAAALALALLPRLWRTRGWRAWLIFGLGLGWAALIRPTGLALAAAIALAAALERKWREAALVFVPAGLVLALWLHRNAGLTGASWNYWQQARELGAGGIPLMANAAFYARELFARALWRPPVSSAVAELMIASAGTALALTGLIRPRTPTGRALGFFTALFFLPHLAWGLQASRYLIPVLPFALWGVWRGLSRLDRRAAMAGAALCVAFSALATVNVARASLYPSDSRSVPPMRTAAWLRAHARPGDVIGAQYDARWNLLTGLPSVHAATGPAATLVVLEDTSAEIRGPGAPSARDEKFQRTDLQNTGAKKIFADAGEWTEVWRLSLR